MFRCVLFTLVLFVMNNLYSQTYSHNHNGITYSYSNLTDQSRCQAEADYMAKNKITGHVWGTIGNFEGVGFGYGPNCNTCTPNRSMRLTGDASAKDNNGRWYRVRSWR